MQKRAVIIKGDERKARNLVQQLSTIRKDVAEKRRAKKDEKRVEHQKVIAEMEEKREAREKRETKEFWSREGKKRRAGADAGGGGKRRR